MTVVFVHKLHERRNEREAETADKYVEYTGHVTQRQRALRRPLQHRTGVCMSIRRDSSYNVDLHHELTGY